MNIGLLTSFVIGGILLVSILAVNADLLQSGVQSSLNLDAKQNVATISTVVGQDLRKVGFRMPDTLSSVYAMDSTRFGFYGDVDDDGDIDSVEWVFLPNSDESSSTNPNDRKCYRIMNGDTLSLGTGVTELSFVFMDSTGTETGSAATLRRIKTALTCESLGSTDNQFETSAWSQVFIPINLQTGN